MASKYISDDLINEVRQQADIVEIISEYVPLERTGKNYKGLCPFHKEKTPSFVVNPDMQLFKCYGCGVGGNVFTFLMQYEKYTFPEAVQTVAQRVGVSLETSSLDQTSPQRQRIDTLYRLHTEAAEYFARQLSENDESQYVRDYLSRRGIDQAAARMFLLGYALSAWDDLCKTFAKKYPRDLLLESGVVIQKKSGVGEYDRFRERLMIPISDERGRVMAFGGRILGDGEPKYLNSPENPIFHKARTLFGLHQAKEAIRRTGTAIIVEGYFDMIVPYSCGVRNVAATMGTALTEQHLRLLQRYAKKVVLVFDADAAGVKATLRTLDLFLQSGFEARAGVLPQGEDPDSFVRKNGAEAFQHVIDKAPLLLDFIRDRILEQYDLSSIEQQIACASQLLPTIVKIRDIVERDLQLNKTADLLKVSDKALLEEFKKISATGELRVQQRKKTPQTPKHSPIPRLEQYLLKALLKDKRLIAAIRAELDPQEVSHPVARKVLETLFVFEDKTDFEAKVLDLFQGTSAQNDLADLFLHTDEIIDPARTVQDCLRQLRQRRFERQTLDLSRKVRDAQEQRNSDTIERFLEQKNRDLLKKKQHYG